ncbi:MAG TPA: SctK family type III secretion system sorting platform protein [Magnetospirillum sp.]|nr:SctK family type III secretion system sorting platform protein [Magnetospirillum sp.]
MVRPDRHGGPASLGALMRGRSPFFSLVYQFNLLPSRYMHASWADELFTPEIWRRLQESPRAEPHLNRMILGDLGVSGTFPADFCGWAARLALVDGTTVDRLALHLGMVVEGAALRRVIAGEEVRRLREALGADGHAFAVQRAPLLAAAAGLPSPVNSGGSPLIERLRSAGISLIGSAMAGLPPEILKRFLLKLPRTARGSFIPSDRSARALALTTRVFKETEPKWASLFASQMA